MARPAEGLMAQRLLRRVQVRPGEIRSVFWSGLWFFSVLSSYYILRPMRDELGAAVGVGKLPWFFAITLAAMLLAHPVFTLVAGRFPSRKVVMLVHRFFSANLVFFFVAFSPWVGDAWAWWVVPVFWGWNAVFNLFVISIFWAFMVDVFSEESGKRVFGLISLGGTLGGVAGSLITTLASRLIGPVYLLLGAALLLEIALFCMSRLAAARQSGRATGVEQARRPQGASESDLRPIGGVMWAGLANVVRSRYLRAISLFVMLFAVTATLLYFQQAEMFAAHYPDRAERTAMFATVDLVVNVLTVLSQLFLTGYLMRTIGLGLTLAALPIISIAGFIALGTYPGIAVLVVFQVLRRAGDYAIARPAREVLFTVVPREDKYKAKNLIDTFVYRAGDQLGAWSYGLFAAVGAGGVGASWAGVPLCVIWLGVALWLGRRQAEVQNYGEGPAKGSPDAGVNGREAG